MVSNEELMRPEDHVLRSLRYVTLDKIMNEIKENGMELLDQRVIDEPELNSQVYETNLVIMKTSEYRRLKQIEKSFNKVTAVYNGEMK